MSDPSSSRCGNEEHGKCLYKKMLEERLKEAVVYMDVGDNIPRNLSVKCHFCDLYVHMDKETHSFVDDGDVKRIKCFTCMIKDRMQYK